MGTKKDGSLSKKVVRIWCTPSLAIEGAFLFLSITIVSFFIVLWGIQSRSLGVSCLIGVLWVVFIIAMGSLRHELFATLIFDKDGISFPSAFKKREFVPYIQYSHVYLGFYAHGFSGFPVTYIVLSTRFLSSNQLAQVNELTQSTDVVKLRFSKRRYKLLHELLPIKQSLMLERVCAELLDVKS